jgi:hypothetical protein
MLLPKMQDVALHKLTPRSLALELITQSKATMGPHTSTTHTHTLHCSDVFSKCCYVVAHHRNGRMCLPECSNSPTTRLLGAEQWRDHLNTNADQRNQKEIYIRQQMLTTSKYKNWHYQCKRTILNKERETRYQLKVWTPSGRIFAAVLHNYVLAVVPHCF